jgi:DNA-binding transcriptional MerR regulator
VNVGEVAALAGVTVRTLHHYDRIGLLSPSGRTAAGLPPYSAADLDRLHQVLLYRELGFPLEEVATLLDDPSADPAEHLRRQHRLLRDRLERTQAMVAAVEKEMEARQMGISLTPRSGSRCSASTTRSSTRPRRRSAGARRGLGAKSRRRTASYSKEAGSDQGRGGGRRVGASPRLQPTSGVRARLRSSDGPRRGALRQQISRNFYDSPPEDARRPRPGCPSRTSGFTRAHYESSAPGPGAVREHRPSRPTPPARRADRHRPRPAPHAVRPLLPPSSAARAGRRGSPTVTPGRRARRAACRASRRRRPPSAARRGDLVEVAPSPGRRADRLLGERRPVARPALEFPPPLALRRGGRSTRPSSSPSVSRRPAACAQDSSRRPASGSASLRRATLGVEVQPAVQARSGGEARWSRRSRRRGRRAPPPAGRPAISAARPPGR